MSKDQSDHKYGYKFGNTDRGILLSILMASLFLVTVAGGTALAGDTGVKDGTDTSPAVGAIGTLAVAVGIGIVLFAPCFELVLILIVLAIISYIIYRLLSGLEEKCRSCNCCWKPSCWACCAGKLICWMITITKWVALIVTVVLAIATVVTLIICFGTVLVALF